LADLFQKTGLEQDTGLLKERWDQDGSTYVTATDTFNFGTPSDQTIHTTTAGKTFYAKQLMFSGTAAVVCTIKDNSTAIMTITFPTTGEFYNFTTPLKFSTSAVWNCDAGTNTITLVGWEE
jgi:hypothetical protein